MRGIFAVFALAALVSATGDHHSTPKTTIWTTITTEDCPPESTSTSIYTPSSSSTIHWNTTLTSIYTPPGPTGTAPSTHPHPSSSYTTGGPGPEPSDTSKPPPGGPDTSGPGLPPTKTPPSPPKPTDSPTAPAPPTFPGAATSITPNIVQAILAMTGGLIIAGLVL